MGQGYEFLDDTMWASKEIYEYTIILNEKPFIWRITPVYGDTMDDDDWEVELVDFDSGERLSQRAFPTLTAASSYANNQIKIQEQKEGE